MPLKAKDFDQPFSRDKDERDRELAELGLRSAYSLGVPLPVEEPAEEEEKDEYNYWPVFDESSQFSRKLLGSIVSSLGSTVQSVGVLNAIGKGWVGEQAGTDWSSDPDDNFIYDIGSAVKWAGSKVAGPTPNMFREGAWGFLFHDTPAALGTAVAFVGEMAGGGWAAKGALKVAPKLLGKRFTSHAALKAETEAAEEAAKRLSFVMPGGRAATEAGKQTALKKIAADSAKKWDIQKSGELVGLGGGGVAMSAMEGYDDAVQTLEAKYGRPLTTEERGTAFQAYAYAAPGGLIELLGAEMLLLKALRRAPKTGGSGLDKLPPYFSELSPAEIAKKGKAAIAAETLSKNLDRITGGRFSAGIPQWTKRLAGGAATEAGQESLQTAYLNMVANSIVGYDENRKLYDGMVHSGGVGGMVGFLTDGSQDEVGPRGCSSQRTSRRDGGDWQY